MTLAVILGLWCALTPWSATGPMMGAYQETPAQESKPAEPPTPTQTPDQSPPPASSPEPQTQKTESTPAPTSTKPKKKSRKKKPTAPASDTPSKVVVRNGSTTEPTAKLSPPGNANQVQNVNQLLAATDANLKVISGRTLDSNKQDTVKQIRTYMDQARKAVDSGDLDQGRNLAFKAHLLSDDLVKH